MLPGDVKAAYLSAPSPASSILKFSPPRPSRCQHFPREAVSCSSLLDPPGLLERTRSGVALCVCVGCVWHVQIQPIAWHGCCFSSASTAADTCSAADPAQAQLTLLKCSCPSPCSQSQPSNSGINASPTVSTPRTGPVTSRSKKCESSCPWTPMPIPSP